MGSGWSWIATRRCGAVPVRSRTAVTRASSRITPQRAPRPRSLLSAPLSRKSSATRANHRNHLIRAGDSTRGNDMASQEQPDIDAVRWEVTDCPLCGAFDDEELLLTTSPCGRAAYRLVSCRRCGLGYLNPRPDQRSIGLFYPADYLCYQSPTPSDSLRARLQRRLKRLVMARHFGTLPPLRHRHEKVLAWLASLWLYPHPHSMTGL